MADNLTTNCLNGELKPGDLVLSIPADEYGCLVGTVLSIDKAGNPEHRTDNPGDGVHVNFMNDGYSQRRLLEIEEMLCEMYGRPTTPGIWPPVDMDYVVMAPDTLIRITGIGRDELTEILDSNAKAAAFCYPVIYPDPDDARMKRLWDRVNQNFADYEKSMLGKDNHEIFGNAEKIAAMESARYYLTEYAHEFSPDTIEGLLKLDNPLKVVAYGWRRHTEDLSDMTGLIRETAIKADIAISGRDPAHADALVMRSFTSVSEKPSVLEQIRRAREEAKDTTAPRRDAPGKDHGPGL